MLGARTSMVNADPSTALTRKKYFTSASFFPSLGAGVNSLAGRDCLLKKPNNCAIKLSISLLASVRETVGRVCFAHGRWLSNFHSSRHAGFYPKQKTGLRP